MPQATITFPEQTSTLLPSAANNFALIGCCSVGSFSLAYTFDPSQAGSVQSSLGNGPVVEAAVRMLRHGRRRVTVLPVTATVAGAIGSISKNGGSGPSITAAGKGSSGGVTAGPWDSLNIALLISAGGAAGTAKFKVALDDQTVDGAHVGTYGLGEVTVPAAKKAEIVGTVDLSTISSWGNGGTLDTLTFIVTSDTGGPSTCTFADPADAADVVSQINAAWSGEATAELVGANRLAIYSVTAGTAGTLTLGSGTANSALGFTNGATAAGSAATYEIPGAGVILTFPAGTYVASDLYTFSTTAPKIAAAAVDAAIVRVEARVAAGEPIGAVWLAQEDADATDTRTMVDALSTALTASRTRGFDLWAIYQVAKSDTDSNVITRLGTFEDKFVTLTAGDCYVTGGALTGARFKRPASWVAAVKAARERFSSDLGNHADRALIGSTYGLTAIGRDERTATTKLATFRAAQTQDGGGFVVFETTASGEVYFYQGRTMAAAGSIYGNLAAVRLLLACARQLRVDLDREVNNDLRLTSAGALAEVEIDRLKSTFTAGLEFVVFEDPEAPDGHGSGVSVADPVYTLSSKTLSASFEVQRRAPAKAVTATVAITDTLTTLEV